MNKIIDKLDLVEVYSILYQTDTEHTFFSSIHRMLTTIDHMLLGHKGSLKKFQMVELL